LKAALLTQAFAHKKLWPSVEEARTGHEVSTLHHEGEIARLQAQHCKSVTKPLATTEQSGSSDDAAELEIELIQKEEEAKLKAYADIGDGWLAAVTRCRASLADASTARTYVVDIPQENKTRASPLEKTHAQNSLAVCSQAGVEGSSGGGGDSGGHHHFPQTRILVTYPIRNTISQRRSFVLRCPGVASLLGRTPSPDALVRNQAHANGQPLDKLPCKEIIIDWID